MTNEKGLRVGAVKLTTQTHIGLSKRPFERPCASEYATNALEKGYISYATYPSDRRIKNVSNKKLKGVPLFLTVLTNV